MLIIVNFKQKHWGFCNQIFERLMKIENKNAFTILKEFCEKVKLKMTHVSKVISEEKAPILFFLFKIIL